MTEAIERRESAAAPYVGAKRNLIEEGWERLLDGLIAYLPTMVDPSESEHLVIDYWPPIRLEGPLALPYLQFAGFGDGKMIRAEVSGNVFLKPLFRLTPEACAQMVAAGWQGNVEDGAPAERNWYLERPVVDSADLAAETVAALRRFAPIVGVYRLTCRAWGAAASAPQILGLHETMREIAR